jgi:hypothetical protein
MKAVRVRKPEGLEGIEGLVYEDAPDPQPARRCSTTATSSPARPW